MAYWVNKRTKKDGTVYWRLVRDDKHIPQSQLLQHGLSPTMSVEEARARVKQLNRLTKADRKADAAKARALAQQKERQELKSAHLPDIFVDEFERDFLRAEIYGDKNYRKALSHWEYARKMIVHIGLPPAHWNMHRTRFYYYMADNPISRDYVSKVLRVTNLWGRFMSLKTGTGYLEIPGPRGKNRERIQDAWLRAGNKGKASAPITPEMLEAARTKLPEPEWRWLYLSVWLGLRPTEVDHIRTARLDTNNETGYPVLWVYQSKLTSLPEDKRHKPVALVFPEQLAVLDMLAQEMKRPSAYTMRSVFGEGFGVYGGRKGFQALLNSRGIHGPDVVTMFGHRSERTTKEHYWNWQKLFLRRPK